MAGFHKNNYGAEPNYTSSFSPLNYPSINTKSIDSAHEEWVGRATNFNWRAGDGDEVYVQARGLWNVLGRTPGQQENLVKNIAGHAKDARKEVRERVVKMFSRVDEEMGRRLGAEIDKGVRGDGARL